MFLGVYTSGSDVAVIEIESDQISWYDYLTSSYRYELRTTQVLRDPSAWYHIMCVLDTTQATSSNRNKIYINGSLVTALTTATYPTQNLDGKFNTAVQHSIGTEGSNLRLFLDAYQTETYFIDGQALTPSDFGETDSATGVWKPKAYSGTYGTNGFFLKFADNSGTTSTTLGKDSSGNGNNWTPNNFSVTAGAGNDSMVDSPTSYGTDTGVGGEVRGNYCTLNPLFRNSTSTAATLANGNLDLTTTGGVDNFFGATFSVNSGKWYYECLVTATGTGFMTGICATADISVGNGGNYRNIGDIYNLSGTNQTSGATYTANDLIGVAIDIDAGTVQFYKNNTAQGATPSFTFTAGTSIFVRGRSDGSGASATFNFGQRPFAYTAPSGFKALVTTNLPTPTIGATSTTQANDYFNVVLYTGTSPSTNSVTGVNFQPDLVWVKSRTSGTRWHENYDVLRPNKKLSSNATDAEYTENMTFNSDGFTTSGGVGPNESGNSYVGWAWKANGAGSSNTAGTITSTVSANTTSGFSIVTYTGTGANATVGHGLGVAPKLVFVKRRNSTSDWSVYFNIDGLGAGVRYLFLNQTGGSVFDTTYWNSTAATSTVFSLGTSSNPNASGGTYVAYCFAEIAGYSKFGSYTGNGSSDGVFVYTGFRPSFILTKRTDSANYWMILDDERRTYNPAFNGLYPNLSDAEGNFGNSTGIDFLSNGFKLRDSVASVNASGGTYIYMAIAESPFKFSLAR
jgi:hypothetical protein